MKSKEIEQILDKAVLLAKKNGLKIINGSFFVRENNEIVACCAIGAFAIKENISLDFEYILKILKIEYKDLMDIVEGFDNRQLKRNVWYNLGKRLRLKFDPEYYDSSRKI